MESFPALKEIKRFDYPVEFFLADAAYLAGLLSENLENFLKTRETIFGKSLVFIKR